MTCLFVLHRNENSHMIKLKSIETLIVNTSEQCYLTNVTVYTTRPTTTLCVH